MCWGNGKTNVVLFITGSGLLVLHVTLSVKRLQRHLFRQRRQILITELRPI